MNLLVKIKNQCCKLVFQEATKRKTNQTQNERNEIINTRAEINEIVVKVHVG